MRTPAILRTKVLGPDPEQQLVDFLTARLPTFVAPTKQQVRRLRREALAKVYLRGILSSVVNAKPRIVWGEVLRPDKSYVIRKLRYEAYPRYWIPGLLYEPTNLQGRVPVVLNPNGHHRGGKAADYKQIRCANLARRGVMALNIEWIGMGELEADLYHSQIAHLDLTGMTGVGLHYLSLSKGLDVLLAHRHADPKRVAVTGLSGGGWQTIVISALDPRVTLSVPVAGYTTLRRAVACRKDIGHGEQIPVDMATVLDYDTMTAMLAPRPALLILNHNDDCCFQTARTKPVIYDAVRPTYAALGAGDKFACYDNLEPGEYNYSPGSQRDRERFIREHINHNYGPNNRSQFYKFLNQHFRLPAGTPDYDIHRADEILTEDELQVGLPAEQMTMIAIARQRAERLCRGHRLPRTAEQKRRLRQRLAEVIRLPRYPASARRVGKVFVLRAGPWSLPVATWAEPRGGPVRLTVNDRGRTVPISNYLHEVGPRYHVELLGMGEAAPPNGPLLTMIDCVGERLLGIQVAQLLATARWVAQREHTAKVHLVADGYSSAMVALMAAALQPRLFASFTTFYPVATLRFLMDWPLRYDEAPSCFCLGLLEVADVPQIRALLEGVEQRFPWRCVLPETRT